MKLRNGILTAHADVWISRWSKWIIASIIAVLIGLVFHVWWNTDKTTSDTLTSVTPTEGLLAYWSFDRNSVVDIHVKDISGNGNDGMLMNGLKPARGKIGQALQFNGVNSYVDGGSGSLLNNLQALTFSSWIYPRMVNGADRIVGKGVSNRLGWVINLLNSDNNIRMQFIAYFTGGAVEHVSVYNAIQKNVWQHIIVTWDGSPTAANVEMYLNGSEMSYSATFDGSGNRLSDTAYNLYIGDPSTSFPYNGLIDEVRIYNRVLARDEIRSLYNVGR